MSRSDKQYKTTLVMVLVFALLSTGYFMYQKYGPDSSKSESDKKNNVLTIKREDLTEIAIKSINNEFSFIKEDGKFKLKSDKSLELDEEFMNSLIESVTVIDAKKLIAQDITEFTDYGLAVPKVNVFLTLADKSIRQIEVGDKSPTASGYYIKLKDEKKVYLVDTSIAEKFNLGKDKFRSKLVFTAKKEDLDLLRFSKAGNIVYEAELDNKNGSKWTLKQPKEERADDSKVDDILSQALSIKVKEFLPIDETEMDIYGLAKPEGALTLRQKGKTAVKILFGKNKENEGKYIIKEGTKEVLFIEGTDFPFLTKTAQDLKWVEPPK